MASHSQSSVPTICVFSPNSSNWKWYAADTVGRVRWLFQTEEPESAIERKIKRPHLGRIFGAFRCVQRAESESAVAIAAHSQFNTMWSSIALRLMSVDLPLLSFSFHFSHLPTGFRRYLTKWAFSRVTRFSVHSEPERERYARHFDIPIERFDLVRWGVSPQSVEIEDAPPPVEGAYLCAMGKDGRDYATLIEAMRRLPELTLVLVAQPHNLNSGGAVPDNVKIFYNIPTVQAINILKHSQFMALPLETDETSCGHITIVSAMFCRKAVVVTGSSGIADYLPEGYEAPTVAARDVDGWVEALRAMASDSARRERCADAGERFGYLYCSHDAACRSTLEIFRKAGIDIAASVGN